MATLYGFHIVMTGVMRSSRFVSVAHGRIRIILLAHGPVGEKPMDAADDHWHPYLVQVREGCVPVRYIERG